MNGETNTRLHNVTIGGNFIGRDQIGVATPEKREITHAAAVAAKTAVFLSYCHQNGDEADRIDQHLQQLGVTVKRDIRDVSAWGSFRAFMDTIRNQDFAVLLISDAYLKSANCMYEVLEIMKEQKYEHRIFPSVLEHGIYQPLKRAAYISYWQDKYNELKEAMAGLDRTNSTKLAIDLKRYRHIADSMDEFLSLVADMNNPSMPDVCQHLETMLKRKGLITP